MFEKEIIGQTDFKRFPYSLKYIEIFQYGRRKLYDMQVQFFFEKINLVIVTTEKHFQVKKLHKEVLRTRKDIEVHQCGL